MLETSSALGIQSDSQFIPVVKHPQGIVFEGHQSTSQFASKSDIPIKAKTTTAEIALDFMRSFEIRQLENRPILDRSQPAK